MREAKGFSRKHEIHHLIEEKNTFGMRYKVLNRSIIENNEKNSIQLERPHFPDRSEASQTQNLASFCHKKFVS